MEAIVRWSKDAHGRRSALWTLVTYVALMKLGAEAEGVGRGSL